jgi:hypothetical protein
VSACAIVITPAARARVAIRHFDAFIDLITGPSLTCGYPQTSQKTDIVPSQLFFGLFSSTEGTPAEMSASRAILGFGAAGTMLDTRFVTSRKANAHPDYQDIATGCLRIAIKPP